MQLHQAISPNNWRQICCVLLEMLLMESWNVEIVADLIVHDTESDPEHQTEKFRRKQGAQQANNSEENKKKM